MRDRQCSQCFSVINGYNKLGLILGMGETHRKQQSDLNSSVLILYKARNQLFLEYVIAFAESMHCLNV